MTKAVILAAGFGSRLMPLTSDRPKGMVALMGLPMLVRQIAVLRAGGVEDISIVGGYRAECLDALGLPVIANPAYDSTNMVESLMCARALFDGKDDVIMAYGDIVYEPRVLAALLQASGEVVVTADLGWQRLWSARMEDYASDVESFRLRADGSLAELGKRPGSLAEVEAQYIGLVRFPAACHAALLAFYDGLDRAARYDGQPFPKMYMTSFIQQLIDRGWNVRPALIENGWLEVDTVEDLQRYEALAAAGGLDPISRLAQAPEPAELLARLLPAPAAAPSGVCDIRAVAARLLMPSEPSAGTLEVLDRLARKIEIAGVLHQRYAEADMKALPDAPAAGDMEAAALLAAYLLAFDRTQDRRHLNTVLKALDGALRSPRPACRHELDLLCARRLGEHG
ncbi:phosphocholine cytidylyltransferase family protein [uncultured Rhodoferax sp.]|uniref:phosphocholine cytidylyltransferase family protein n=1 Tax=uncultured Rhodoferax sp. TaxID=223188 RepID=UPI0025E324F8|nr:phosphocholine cytidylyltransferase family protein [uncultured Rhodoferax sp.]